MVVHTCSEKARAAQQSVMEFLLINHPLDCPICDQGGECQLQDLAVGYGGSSSRYQEEKRVVFHKDLGPLVSAEEMSRCIHCTRCVRFGQEIAGVMELGMLGRGEHSEITSFVGRSIESELSGNMIDICPVGALTSKPFRYSARTWELARRRSVSPHDSLGANLVIQVKGDRVMRVVPFEDEAVNECWISDRDRFSYEGLNSEDRLSAPMIKGADGKWQEASWADALQAVAQGLSRVRDSFGAGQIGALASEYATLEEYALLGRLVRALGSENIDFRLRQTDAFDAALSGAVAGHAHRRAGQPGPRAGGRFVPAQGPPADGPAPAPGRQARHADPAGRQRRRRSADAGRRPHHRGALRAGARAGRSGRRAGPGQEQAVPAEFASVTPGEQAKIIAASLASGSNTAVLMGNLAVASAQASTLAANGQAVAALAGGKFGFLTSGGNTVGGYLAGAVPGQGGKNAAAMLAEPLKAYVVLHAEPLLDADNGGQAVRCAARSSPSR